ncbi:DUF2860 domain-containing protein [Aestuariirhabdus sp. Z084]|uniref:DUF2860 family protein n=1 Tax=Aestuariirhabdus haliotis TaxID=2918751 RepID=UPI00201B394A|nr:DUF2860 family protein [Aestuariirhabdus haliotis]MCL6416427.1 DUF2860 domain-containing protein [Aestuariirhabdus haliotis]MCL6420407.1 DUF2860 domain-containing protein [Aestuariirhabdus haliotis]
MKRYLLAPLASAVMMASTGAVADVSPLDAIPQDTGFSGYVAFGAASNKLESNMVTGTSLGDFDNERTSSLTKSPSSETESSGFINGEVRYTWANSRTQVVLGNDMVDALRYDLATQIGVRQEFGNSGVVGISYLFSAFPTQVFKDPYQTGVKRSDTDQTSNGFRITWDGIIGSNFDAMMSFREVDVDDEFSGTALGLSAADRRLLERDGDDSTFELLYRWNVAKGHTIAPAIRYIDRDRDGGAMRSEETGFQLSYLYSGSQKWNFSANLYAANDDYDKRSPIPAFNNKKRDDDILGGSFTAFYNEPMGWKDWRVMASAAYYEGDSNISFYDSEVRNFSLGMFYAF